MSIYLCRLRQIEDALFYGAFSSDQWVGDNKSLSCVWNDLLWVSALYVVYFYSKNGVHYVNHVLCFHVDGPVNANFMFSFWHIDFGLENSISNEVFVY